MKPLQGCKLYQKTKILESTISHFDNEYRIEHELKQILKEKDGICWECSITTNGEITDISKKLEPLETFEYCIRRENKNHSKNSDNDNDNLKNAILHRDLPKLNKTFEEGRSKMIKTHLMK